MIRLQVILVSLGVTARMVAKLTDVSDARRFRNGLERIHRRSAANPFSETAKNGTQRGESGMSGLTVVFVSRGLVFGVRMIRATVGARCIPWRRLAGGIQVELAAFIVRPKSNASHDGIGHRRLTRTEGCLLSVSIHRRDDLAITQNIKPRCRHRHRLIFSGARDGFLIDLKTVHQT